ncbi:MAG: T9SS type A sorting domain-containing protein [candidate division Zixibacteria bacterium]|nr:T9SS type A sorting domain-containing protein [candidate division Zixibacteria bacterium]
MRNIIAIAFSIILISTFSTVISHPGYTGYSGAPGSQGICASSCHGTGGGTVEVLGFPSEYIPGETYTITISHNGDSAIAQFNGSCRVGVTPDNAGTISDGANTAVYSVDGETNGIRFVSPYLDLGTFDWTAPAESTGVVKLYISGMQGESPNGKNNTIVLTAEETSGPSNISEDEVPDLFTELANYPNPFNSSTVIEFFYDYEKPSNVRIGIFNITGQMIYSRYVYCDARRIYYARWNGLDEQGNEVPTGVYFYRLESIYGVNTSKMIYMK